MSDIVEDVQRPSMKEKLDALKSAMLKEEQIDIPVVHHFSKGIYCREMHLPAGATAVGKIHKYPHINILSKGEVSIVTEDGVFRVKAPYTMHAPAGQNCAAYAHEDTVWTTIHATEDTDLEVIENKFIAKSREDYLAFEESLKLEAK